jgi:hypothetical protein
MAVMSRARVTPPGYSAPPCALCDVVFLLLAIALWRPPGPPVWRCGTTVEVRYRGNGM